MTGLVTEYLPLVAGAPDGIKKLRALILELAVRGKLVPQDSSDEPSQEILTRAELALTSREDKRKTKRLPSEQEDAEPPYDVPKGWSWSRLSKIAEVIRGVTYSKSDARDQPGPNLIPLLRGNNISDGHLNFDGPVFVPSSLVNVDQYIQAGDLVIAMSSGSADLVGKAAQAEQAFQGAFGAFCGVVRPAIADFFPYFGFFFQTPFYRSNAAGRGKGIGINNLQKTALQSMYVPVPPLAEQHRIVTKVDELMALCDQLEADQSDAQAAHAQLVQALLGSLTQATDAADFRASWQRLSEHFHTLFTTEASIDELKQTVLQLAVMGRLVPQDGTEGSVDDLVAELLTHWRKSKRQRKIELLNETAAEYRFPIPTSWRWLHFGFLSETRLGKMLDARKNSGQLKPYLRNTNVQWRRFEMDDVKELRLEDDELEEFRLIKGDLLVCEGGEPGRCAIWLGQSKEMYFQKALHRVRPVAGTLPEYLLICLEADCLSGKLASLFTGATIKHLTGEKLERYSVPIPPPAEQHRIVAKVDELMALCAQLKSQLTEARQQHAQLASVLVEQAVAAH